jgi:hypothetical protein
MWLHTCLSTFPLFILLDGYQNFNEMESGRRKIGFQVDMKTVNSLQFLFSDKLEA